jgi:hypothetical protein
MKVPEHVQEIVIGGIHYPPGSEIPDALAASVGLTEDKLALKPKPQAEPVEAKKK